MSQFWVKQAHIQQFLDIECAVIDVARRCMYGPRVALVGEVYSDALLDTLDYPERLHISQSEQFPSPQVDKLCAMVAQWEALPLASDSLSSVFAPHVLEMAQQPHAVLRELERVLQAEGHLLLTGFNPYSLLALQKKCHSQSALQKPYYSPRRVIDWMKVLGFDIVSSSVFYYLPMLKSERIRRVLDFAHSVGDRWFPMSSAAYCIVAKKKLIANTMVGFELGKMKKKKTKLRVSIPAKVKRDKI